MYGWPSTEVYYGSDAPKSIKALTFYLYISPLLYLIQRIDFSLLLLLLILLLLNTLILFSFFKKKKSVLVR